MLIYIDNGSGTKSAIHIKSINSVGTISEIENEGKKKKTFCFGIGTDKGTIVSRSYSTREEAEMVQVSAVSILNALELFFDRYKHIPEDRVTPVYFQTVDPREKKLVPGKITLHEHIVYTIVI